MNNEEVKNRIVEIVTEKQGCKATELCAIKELIFKDCKPIPELIDELIEEERIFEIEYVLPAMNYRIKSFLLPAETQIKMKMKISREPPFHALTKLLCPLE